MENRPFHPKNGKNKLHQTERSKTHPQTPSDNVYLILVQKTKQVRSRTQNRNPEMDTTDSMRTLEGRMSKMRLTRVVFCLIVPAFYMGCDGCSDNKEERRQQLEEDWDRDDRKLLMDSDNPEELIKSIKSPCNANSEGATLPRGKYEYVCTNGKWTLKED